MAKSLTLPLHLHPHLLRRGLSQTQKNTSPVSRFTGKCYRCYSAQASPSEADVDDHQADPRPTPDLSHLNPPPDDYSRFIFQDKCRTVVHAGSGGHGCVSFLREKFIEEGPANGGDGGSGGSIFIQAVEGLNSLHKLARRGTLRASRGRNGRGKTQGGKRGTDVLIQVPVGTVVREIDRYDPVVEMERTILEEREMELDEDGDPLGDLTPQIHRDRFVLYPGSKPSDFLMTNFPRLAVRRQNIAALEPKAPIYLDLSQPMDKPMLLAAGAIGGLGNPHFVRATEPKPKFASKGEGGMRLDLDLELKLLADVGLVGKPNAGKSTLLRSLTNSRTRIGHWEFTTLSPSIGTVVIDNHTGRPLIESKSKIPRTNFTIADIPGLIEDAHLDRGLGLGFLRHIERARSLAFVVDLSTDDPVEGLKVLWNELGQYQRIRDVEVAFNSNDSFHQNNGPDSYEEHVSFGDPQNSPSHSKGLLPPLVLPSVHTKPWLVIATKADKSETQGKFKELQNYISNLEHGLVPHPGGNEDSWRKKIHVVPVSAMRGEGVNRIPKLIVGLLDEEEQPA